MTAPLDILARARVADPVSSVRAAREMNDSGATGTQAGWFLEAVSRWPGRTASELAEASNGRFDRVQANRRLADLDRKQLIRKTESRVSAVTGRLECTWSPRNPHGLRRRTGRVVVKSQLLATLRAVRYLERETGATTVRDVQRHCQFSSSATAIYWLRAARHAGLVTWKDGQARTIQLTPAGGLALTEAA